MAKVKFEKEIDFEIIEDEIEDEYDEDVLIIKDRGLVILDLESLIIEANQDEHIGPYSMLEYLEPYIEEIYDYTLALKAEYDEYHGLNSCCACADCKCLES